jgi:transcriptional regulator with XRE-family HTH domain
MPTSCIALNETARKSRAALLRGLASVGQANVANALGVSETMVSRWKSEGELDRIAALLDLCGLKATPRDHKCYPPDYVEWLTLGNNIAGRIVRSAEDIPEDESE